MAMRRVAPESALRARLSRTEPSHIMLGASGRWIAPYRREGGAITFCGFGARVRIGCGRSERARDRRFGVGRVSSPTAPRVRRLRDCISKLNQLNSARYDADTKALAAAAQTTG